MMVHIYRWREYLECLQDIIVLPILIYVDVLVWKFI
jgi:hypothetical protein